MKRALGNLQLNLHYNLLDGSIYYKQQMKEVASV